MPIQSVYHGGRNSFKLIPVLVNDEETIEKVDICCIYCLPMSAANKVSFLAYSKLDTGSSFYEHNNENNFKTALIGSDNLNLLLKENAPETKSDVADHYFVKAMSPQSMKNSFDSKEETMVNRYTWNKSNVGVSGISDTWYTRGYISYIDDTGNNVTVYSEDVAYQKLNPDGTVDWGYLKID